MIRVRHHLAERALSVLNGLEELGPFRDMGREDKALAIFEGASEIQRMLIGRAVTGLDVS